MCVAIGNDACLMEKGVERYIPAGKMWIAKRRMWFHSNRHKSEPVWRMCNSMRATCEDLWRICLCGQHLLLWTHMHLPCSQAITSHTHTHTHGHTHAHTRTNAHARTRAHARTAHARACHAPSPAHRIIQTGLEQCIQVEAALRAQQLDSPFELTHAALAAAIRRASQLGTLMLAAEQSAEVGGA